MLWPLIPRVRAARYRRGGTHSRAWQSAERLEQAERDAAVRRILELAAADSR
jgi:hypothetical protein